MSIGILIGTPLNDPAPDKTVGDTAVGVTFTKFAPLVVPIAAVGVVAA